jgi:hypothetical protein
MSLPDLVPETAVRHRPGILFHELDGEMVLLDPEAGIYFGLNAVGTRAWSLIGSGATLGAAQTVLLAEFEASPEQVWEDLAALVRKLLEHRLLEIVPPAERNLLT